MRTRFEICSLVLMSALLLGSQSQSASAGEPGTKLTWLAKMTGWFAETPKDVRTYNFDDPCQTPDCHSECIKVVPVTECVEGKKKVYDCKVRYEYVTVPEVRYRWKKRWVTKEIPCEYCKPVCHSEEIENSFGQERWDRTQADCCGEVHCRSIEPKHEKGTCKCCGSAPGETTIKVRYKTCVKEPYTVYRRVQRPVCVKQPHYEDVDVSITRYECEDCGCD